jgi:hypothetical protein
MADAADLKSSGNFFLRRYVPVIETEHLPIYHTLQHYREVRRDRMARTKSVEPDVEIAELLRSLLIVQLGLAKVAQNDIRKIVGCSMGRVSDVLKHLPKGNR